ncbi:18945_t:CDS:2 [Rhizophagus irregularis]|nr:18945_t:CDS:2 [Rhizophagus irregularis]
MKYSIILFTICFALAVATATSAATLASKKRSLIIGKGDWVSSRAVNDDKNDNGKGKPVDAQITFYSGDSLKNSACYGNNGLRNYDANENDMIAAMHMNELELCFDCIEIRNPANNKNIIVKVIDKCAGCPPDGNNVDLTPFAFKQLADIILGRVNIEWRPLNKCPDKGRWPIFEEIDRSN